MKSLQIIEWGKPLEMRETLTPSPNGKEILVSVEACGVCHSDLHIHEGFFDLGNGTKFPISSRGVNPPFTMGHEPVGRVIAVGPLANLNLVGKSFVIYPWISCETCEPCRNNLSQICDAPKIIGTRVDGAYADHLLVPDEKYLVEYGDLDLHLACTMACSGLTVYSAIKKIDPKKLSRSDSILIIGAGGLGLSAIILAKALTKAQIVVVDIDEKKLEVARQLGADFVVLSNAAEATAQLLEFTGEGNGLAASLDFVGLPTTLDFSLACLRKGGIHVHVGLYGGAYQLSLPPLSFKMLQIKGSYVGTLAEFKELISLAQGGLEFPLPIEKRPLAEANQALDDLRNGNVVGRLVLKP